MKKFSIVLIALFVALTFASGCTDSREQSAVQNEEADYVISYVKGPFDWDSLPVMDITIQPWPEYEVDIAAYAQLAYDDETLFVRMWAQEADIRAVYERDDIIPKTYEDSCLEFFVRPVSQDARYMNFEFNPNCAVTYQIGQDKIHRLSLVATENPFNACSVLTEDGWEITYEIPFDLIRMCYPAFNPTSGYQMYGNFYKCGNLTPQKHYLAWKDIESETPNFHVPESFGILEFE